MLEWLVPVAIFWPLAALYLGGAPIRIEGGSGIRQLAGLLLHFSFFLAVWAVARALLSVVMPGWLALVLAAILSVILLQTLAKLAFRILGVRIASAEAAG